MEIKIFLYKAPSNKKYLETEFTAC